MLLTNYNNNSKKGNVGGAEENRLKFANSEKEGANMRKLAVFGLVFLVVVLLLNMGNPKTYAGESDDDKKMQLSIEGSTKLYELGTVIEEQFKDEYEALFAGEWLDEDFNPHYAITRFDKVIAELAEKIGVKLHIFKYSYAELLEIQDRISSYVLPENGMLTVSSAVDKNIVEVLVNVKFLENADELLKSDKYLINFMHIIVLVSTELTIEDFVEYSTIKGVKGKYVKGNPCSVGFRGKKETI